MTEERDFGEDELAALQGFAKLWPEILKRGESVGLWESGLDLTLATELARNVYLAAFYDGATHGAERLSAFIRTLPGKAAAS